MNIIEVMKRKLLILDGAMGTMLESQGALPGENPVLLNITNPSVVYDVHRKYVEAGANMICANTFGCSKNKLSGTGYTQQEVISAGISIAKSATSGTDSFVALDIGPIGEMLEPMGTLSFEQAYEEFAGQIIAGANAGADVVLIETMSDLYEVRAAVLAARENSSLPIFCTMTFQQDGRTFTGTPVSVAVATLEGLGVDAIGVNCSLGPVELYPIVEELCSLTSLPVIIKPNAGLPDPVSGQYPMSAEQFYTEVEKLVKFPVSAVGGCCGTNPRAIELISRNLSKSPDFNKPNTCFTVSSATKTVSVSDDVKVIGERINPTGKKLMKQALLSSDLSYILNQAVEQQKAGADIFYINVGTP